MDKAPARIGVFTSVADGMAYEFGQGPRYVAKREQMIHHFRLRGARTSARGFGRGCADARVHRESSTLVLETRNFVNKTHRCQPTASGTRTASDLFWENDSGESGPPAVEWSMRSMIRRRGPGRGALR